MVQGLSAREPDFDLNYRTVVELIKKFDLILLLGKALVADDPMVSIKRKCYLFPEEAVFSLILLRGFD